ncbi:GAF domain-containing protein [Puniceicoccaceae bacterium K14]|nr:GAF domain-containing protein [Puniceicoccaceae bacterium K14]
MTSFNYIPDPEIVGFASRLDNALQSLAETASPAEMASLVEFVSGRYLLSCFQDINALEGSIWIVDELGKNLVPIYNSGIHSDNFVLKFKQPIYQGIISMVFATEMPFLEKDIENNRKHDDSLDKMLKLKTESMAIVPLFYAGAIRGVISAINFSPDSVQPEKSKNDYEHHILNTLQSSSAVIGKLIDSEMREICLGKRE